MDLKDRQKEIQELEELRNKVFASGTHDDPNQEFERVIINIGWKRLLS